MLILLLGFLGFANANLLIDDNSGAICHTCNGNTCASGLTCSDHSSVSTWQADYHKAHGGTCNDDQIEIFGTHTVDTCANACRGHTWTSGYSDLGPGYCENHEPTEEGYYQSLLATTHALYDSDRVQE